MSVHLQKDFQDFTDAKEISPPQEVTATILQRVNSKLNPKISVLVFKLALVQLVIGTLTLLFCPQFDFSLTNNYDLFHFFHHTFGVYGCMVACGTMFLGAGSLFAGFILSLDESRKIRKSRFLFFPSLALASLTVFVAMGASIYLDLFAFWLLGAITSGMLTFEVGPIISYWALNK